MIYNSQNLPNFSKVLNFGKVLNIALLLFAFLLTTLSPTGIFPYSLREVYVKPYVLKALPIILIWIKIWYEQIRFEQLSVKD